MAAVVGAVVVVGAVANYIRLCYSKTKIKIWIGDKFTCHCSGGSCCCGCWSVS